jgi:putative ABC transport system substrate-binding protein
VAAFRKGLSEAGFVEGRNVAIEYRWAGNDPTRLPALATDLVSRPVAVIYAGENASALAAKAATTTIPIVFRIGGDPIQLGLVTSLNRPGGNATGVSFLQTTTTGIRVQMLHEAAPNARVMGLLVNPANPNAGPESQETRDATRKLGLDLHVANAGSAAEIDAAIATLVEGGARALIVIGDPLFNNRRQQLIILTAHHRLPTIFNQREYADIGGLMSYGANPIDASRLAGTYVGRILKGDKPPDLPVQQSVKVELIINLITAKVLGLTFPLTLLGRADEVIE